MTLDRRWPTATSVLDQLVAMGCEYEGMNGSYIAVNVPPTTALPNVCSFLSTGHVQWEHADPTYEELHRGEGAVLTRR